MTKIPPATEETGHSKSTQIGAGLSQRPDRLAYTAREFAELTGVSYGAVCRMGREGHLTRVRMGKHKVIPAWEVERFMQTPAPREATP